MPPARRSTPRQRRSRGSSAKVPGFEARLKALAGTVTKIRGTSVSMPSGGVHPARRGCRCRGQAARPYRRRRPPVTDRLRLVTDPSSRIGAPDRTIRFERRAMGSPLRLAVVGATEGEARRAWAAVDAEIEAAEQALSRYRESSDLTRANRAAGRWTGEVHWVDVDPQAPARARGGRSGGPADRRPVRRPRAGRPRAPRIHRGGPVPGTIARPGRRRRGRRPGAARPPRTLAMGRWPAPPHPARRARRPRRDRQGPRSALGLAQPPSGDRSGHRGDARGGRRRGRRRTEPGRRTVVGRRRGPAHRWRACRRARRSRTARSPRRASSSIAGGHPMGVSSITSSTPRTGEPGGHGLVAVTVAHPDPAWAEVWSKTLFLAGRDRDRRTAPVRAAWRPGG